MKKVIAAATALTLVVVSAWYGVYENEKMVEGPKYASGKNWNLAAVENGMLHTVYAAELTSPRELWDATRAAAAEAEMPTEAVPGATDQPMVVDEATEQPASTLAPENGAQSELVMAQESEYDDWTWATEEPEAEVVYVIMPQSGDVGVSNGTVGSGSDSAPQMSHNSANTNLMGNYTENGMTPIMGVSGTTVEQMVAYYNAIASYPSFYQNTEAPTIEDLCRIYYNEATAEGVRPEVAFCQAMFETGYLRFGGDVSITQFNFAGLGATGNGASGNYYGSVTEGVRAQIQHLKAYASTAELNRPCVDSRFRYVRRGTAPYVEWLGIHENPYGTGWAVMEGYGRYIVNNCINRLFSY